MIGDTLVDLKTAWNSDSIAWAIGCGKPQLTASHHAGEIDGSYEFREDFSRLYPFNYRLVLRPANLDTVAILREPI